MPTKKTRVGFIPRKDVLEIINKLSNENNLSYSKIINILVEEALFHRGLINISNGLRFDYKNQLNNSSDEKILRLTNEFRSNFKNKLIKEKNINCKEVKEEHLDNEIYSKFLIFLEFQERMKKK